MFSGHGRVTVWMQEWGFFCVYRIGSISHVCCYTLLSIGVSLMAVSFFFLWMLLCHCMQDWGFFVSYLLGSISLVVLGVGSIAPG